MKHVLEFLWAFGPMSLVNFPAQILQEGLPFKPKAEDLIPKKSGDFNHGAKNTFVATVRADVQFWAQGMAFVFWFSHIIRTFI